MSSSANDTFHFTALPAGSWTWRSAGPPPVHDRTDSDDRVRHLDDIFRRVRKGGHLGEPPAPAAVRDIVKERCALAGIEGSFSAHSLRAGLVTEAGRQNMPLPETMAMTGHQSVATVVGYFRAESAPDGRLGRMLDEE